jgi:hypothetical protein
MQALFGSKKGFSALLEPDKADLMVSKGEEGLFIPDNVNGEGPMASSEKEKKEKDEREAAREALLEDVVRFPYSATQDRYGRLGWSFYKGNQVRDRMVQEGWIKVRTIKRPDGMVKVFELTEPGKEQAERSGLKVERTWRKGGLEHGYWVNEIAHFLKKQGFAVKVEKALGMGKSVDLEARRGGRKIAIEVETGKSDAVSNIRKDLEAGYDRIMVVCLGGVLKEKIMEQVRGVERAGKERVLIVSLKEAMNPDLNKVLTA